MSYLYFVVVLILWCLFAAEAAESWEKIGMDGKEILVLNGSADNILVGTARHGIYQGFIHTKDTLEYWRIVFGNPMMDTLTVRSISRGYSGDWIVVGTSNGVFTSNPYMNVPRWVEVFSGIDVYGRDGSFIAGGSRGLYREGTTNAIRLDTLMPFSDITGTFWSCVAHDELYVYAGGLMPCFSGRPSWGGVMVTKDFGETWETWDKGLTHEASVSTLTIIALSGKVLYFAGMKPSPFQGLYSCGNRGIHLRITGDTSWSSAGLEKRNINAIVQSPYLTKNSSEMVVATDSGVYRALVSINSKSLLWQKVGDLDINVNCISFDTMSKQFPYYTLLAGTTDGIYRYDLASMNTTIEKEVTHTGVSEWTSVLHGNRLVSNRPIQRVVVYNIHGQWVTSIPGRSRFALNLATEGGHSFHISGHYFIGVEDVKGRRRVLQWDFIN